MVGALLTLLFALGAAGVGILLLSRLTERLDPALRFGLGGLAGLAAFGMLTLPIGLLPDGLHWGMYGVGLLALLGYWPLITYRPKLSRPETYRALILLAALLAAAYALVEVLSPSDSYDWDTLAYHLAVPKIWLQDGQIHYISFIHHSNFPQTVDALFIWGLEWGGQSGAKCFSLAFALFGGVALFGLARERFGERAGWWALLAYVGIPMVAWEAGTGYIDVANGLFAALGILLAATYAAEPEKREYMWLSAIFLGFAAGSKYTGLQTIGVVAVILGGMALLPSQKSEPEGQQVTLKSAVLLAVVSVAIASPWYVKNIVNTGNPVYPFFYSIFRGKNWDAFSDQIYKNQQQTFGAGRSALLGPSYTAEPLEPARLGSAVLGLAYQPGRYADPGPTLGLGFPFVSLGAIPIIGLLAWMFAGRIGKFEGVTALAVLLSFAMWFVLSEQSRYILGLAFAMSVLAAGAAEKLKPKLFIQGALLIQFVAALLVLTRYGDPQPVFAEKLKTVIGGMSAEDYQKHYVSFYEPAQDLNDLAKGGRVALYDEVFGYFLDVPYFWANPGHSTEMGYEQMQTADQLVAAFKRLGITYLYINLDLTFGRDPDKIAEWMAEANNAPQTKPRFVDRAQRMKDPQTKYPVLLADAVASGKLTILKAYGRSQSRLIIQVNP